MCPTKEYALARRRRPGFGGAKPFEVQRIPHDPEPRRVESPFAGNLIGECAACAKKDGRPERGSAFQPCFGEGAHPVENPAVPALNNACGTAETHDEGDAWSKREAETLGIGVREHDEVERTLRMQMAELAIDRERPTKPGHRKECPELPLPARTPGNRVHLHAAVGLEARRTGGFGDDRHVVAQFRDRVRQCVRVAADAADAATRQRRVVRRNEANTKRAREFRRRRSAPSTADESVPATMPLMERWLARTLRARAARPPIDAETRSAR